MAEKFENFIEKYTDNKVVKGSALKNSFALIGKQDPNPSYAKLITHLRGYEAPGNSAGAMQTQSAISFINKAVDKVAQDKGLKNRFNFEFWRYATQAVITIEKRGGGFLSLNELTSTLESTDNYINDRLSEIAPIIEKQLKNKFEDNIKEVRVQDGKLAVEVSADFAHANLQKYGLQSAEIDKVTGRSTDQNVMSILPYHVIDLG